MKDPKEPDDISQGVSQIPRALLLGVVVAVAWLYLLVSVWGGPDRVAFGSPDEALTRQATIRIETTGFPHIAAPFDDPEGLFAPRLWVKRGDVAIPTHTPTMPYLLAAAERNVPNGEWLVLLMPALGMGAAVAGLYLSVARYRWLAVLLPGLAFPWTFRLLKPWENMAMFVSIVAIAFLAAAIWRATLTRTWFIASWLLIGTAAAVRPDQILLLIAGATGLFLLAENGPWAKTWVVIMAGLATTIAATAFVVGNLAVTGDPLIPPAYLLRTQPGAGVWGRTLPYGISQMASLVLPNGKPDLGGVLLQARKYLWDLGAIWMLTAFTALALASMAYQLILRGKLRRVWLGAFLTILAAYFFVSRVSSTNWGAETTKASIGHSLPRYVALLFGGMGVLALHHATSLTNRLWRTTALVGLTVLAFFGGMYLYNGEVRTSLKDAAPLIATYTEYATAVDEDLPANAVIYVRFADKFLWSVRPIGVLPTEPGARKEHVRFEPLVRSLGRALSEGYHPYVMELTNDEKNGLLALLLPRGLALREVSVGETPRVTKLLLRWKTWEVVENG